MARCAGVSFNDVCPVVLDDLEDHRAVHPRILAINDDAATGNEGREDRSDRKIKGKRGEQRPGQPFAPTVLLVCPPDIIDQAAMLDHDALGRAGGTGSVDDVGEIVGRDRRPWIRDRISPD